MLDVDEAVALEKELRANWKIWDDVDRGVTDCRIAGSRNQSPVSCQASGLQRRNDPEPGDRGQDAGVLEEGAGTGLPVAKSVAAVAGPEEAGPGGLTQAGWEEPLAEARGFFFWARSGVS